jgi:hypothetical protein
MVVKNSPSIPGADPGQRKPSALWALPAGEYIAPDGQRVIRAERAHLDVLEA